MQVLVYTFVGLAGLAIGAAGYFGFSFSPIEALLTALVFVCCAIVFTERSLRLRAEARLEKGIGDLSRLLSTDAQAGQVLSQRINALVDVDAERRLNGVEADLSVLGTVIKQVAEAVADLEETRHEPAPLKLQDVAEIVDEPAPGPVIPLEMVKQALDENRLIYHIQPVVTLPQRRPHAYDLVPRLMMDDGDLAERADFMPRSGGEAVVRRIEGMAVNEAITIIRRARNGGTPVNVNVPISRVTLGDNTALDLILVALDANRGITQSITFVVTEEDWSNLSPAERAAVQSIARKGATFSLLNVRSLRLDFTELSALGVASVRINASRFVNQPEAFTDIHASDVANYIKRYGVDLIATDVSDEQQIISVLEDGVLFAQGRHIAGPGPVRPDLLGSLPLPMSAQRR